jgi:hypothetical protein
MKMPNDETTNSNSAAETPKRRDAIAGKPNTSTSTTSGAGAKNEGSSATPRTWSAGVIAGVAAAGLGLLVAAGIGGAAIGQAVDHGQHDRHGSSQVRDHDQAGKQDGQGRMHDAPFDGQGMPDSGMPAPGSVPLDPNATPAPGDAPFMGQSPTDPSVSGGGNGPGHNGGNRPGHNG